MNAVRRCNTAIGYSSKAEAALSIVCGSRSSRILAKRQYGVDSSNHQAQSPWWRLLSVFNKRSKRYERQGILATPNAIAKAEEECLEDADERAKRRKQDAARRLEADKELVAQMTEAIMKRFPAARLK